MNTVILAPLALALALPQAAEETRLAPAAKLVFQPAEGSSVTRTYEWEATSSTDSTSSTLDGSPTDEVPAVETSTRRARSLRTTDTYEETADGRPVRLLRAYEDLTEEFEAELSIEIMGQKAELTSVADGTSELDGRKVRFAWDADASEFTRRFADDEEGDASLLDGLAVEMDYVDLLPADEVDEGDTWTVDASAFANALFPGGALPIELESDMDAIEGVLDPSAIPSAPEILWGEGEIAGEARLEFKGTRESEGVSVAVIAIELELEASADLIDRLDEAVAGAAPDGVEVELTIASFSFAIEGEGELLWDLEAKRAHGFELGGDTRSESEFEAEVNADGESLQFARFETRSGRLETTCVVE